MKLRRRPGAYVAFIDAFTEETLLKIECSADDVDLVSFRLYNRTGMLVADSGGSRRLGAGLEVSIGDGEQLLCVPASRDDDVRYRLYSSRGALLTWSDGLRTQIFGGVRVEGNKHLAGRPPSARTAASGATGPGSGATDAG
jgi:hypothetical protein